MKYSFLCIILFIFGIICIMGIITYLYSKKLYENYNKIYEGFNKYENDNEKTFVLLGDSILNNKTYTSTGKGVDDLLMEKTNIRVYSYAEDYAKIVDVYNQIDNIPSYLNNPNTTIFISLGGNDILTYYYDKDNNVRDTTVLSPMFISYKKVVKHIHNRMPKTKIVLLDIYYPDNIHFKQFHPVINTWNQQLYSYVNDYNNNGIYGVLKISDMLTNKEDFSFGIEPSSIGGEKIADGILRY